jgi:hypothetical protein
MKIFGATFFPNYEITNKLRDLGGDKGFHGQFRVICKCKSMADGNRKVQELTNNDKVFRTNWCCETGNEIELKLCEQEDVWVRIDNNVLDKKENYISKSQLLNQ